MAPPRVSQEWRKKREELLKHVAALDKNILPFFPARELHSVIPWIPAPEMFGDGRKYAKNFMESSNKLRTYFIELQKEDEPTKEQLLQLAPVISILPPIHSVQKEIEIMEEELKIKKALIKVNSHLLLMWRLELKEQLDRHSTELERA